MEKRLQSQIIKWLKSRGCYVIKHSAIAGVPTGCPDISAYYDGAVIFIEVKASLKAKYQPLQKETLARLKDWFEFVYVVAPENWPEIQTELETQFF